MPILNVEIVTPPNEPLPPGLAAEIAECAGIVLETGPGRTWVRLHALSLDLYAENGGGPPEGVLPVFVTLLLARWPEPAELDRRVAALTAAVAKACGRPAENVHVLTLPEAVGRVAFGGKMLR